MIGIFSMLAILGTMIAPPRQAIVARTNFMMTDILQPSEGYEDLEDIDRYDQTYTFTFGKTYWLYSVGNSWNSETDDFTIENLRFARYSDSYGSAYLSSPIRSPVSFTSYQPTSSLWYIRERTTAGLAYRCLSTNDSDLTPSNAYYRTNNGNYYLETALSQAGTGPYTFTVSISDLFTWVKEYIRPYMDISTNGYSEGYADGKSTGYTEGKRDGDELGYQRGFQEGIESTDAGSVFGGLFGAIVDIPIKVLNGTLPLAIFDVPIVSITITFLVIALLLFIIKRFI